MPVTPWNDAILDRFAHEVSFEIRACTSQLEILVADHGDAIPMPPDGFSRPGAPPDEGPKKDALLHSSLVHLRSLDDFLTATNQTPGRVPDIQARQWFQAVGKAWQPQLWLDPRDRALMDWWVVHLSSLRAHGEAPPRWRPATYGAALCTEVERFFAQVEDQLDPDRLAAFDNNVREDVKRRRPLFEAACGHS
jgi:hypothetical protein